MKKSAIRLEACKGVEISKSKFHGYDEAISAFDTENIRIKDIEINSSLEDELIDNIIIELNKKFDEIKNEKTCKTGLQLKENLTNIATNVISEVILKMIGVK